MPITQMPATTRILLNYVKWDKQELLDRITNDKFNEFFEQAHVLNPFVDRIDEDIWETYECNSCFLEYPYKVSWDLCCQIVNKKDFRKVFHYF